jgi:hypothetical protein
MEQNYLSDKPYNIEIDQTSKDHFKTITTWARIIALINFISAGLSILRVFTKASGNVAVLIGALFGTLIWIGIVIMLYLFLLRFANKTNNAIETQSQEHFNAGISSLKSFFQVYGILLIIVLSLCLIVFMFAGLGMMMRS